jgi:hypothetical protein
VRIAGLYIVEALNGDPISVNANDPRMADRCLKVTRGHVKVGKANDLAWRERGYWKVFGQENVRFRPLAVLQETRVAERCLLQALGEYRQRGPSGRRTEWLLGITASEAAALAREHLAATDLAFEWVWCELAPEAGS